MCKQESFKRSIAWQPFDDRGMSEEIDRKKLLGQESQDCGRSFSRRVFVRMMFYLHGSLLSEERGKRSP